MSDSDLLQKVRHTFPDIQIHRAEVNTDGLMNDVLIVNQQRVFRFAKDEEWIRECLRRETRVLDLVRRHVEMPVPVFDVRQEDCVSYRLLPGQGLDRDTLLRLPEAIQDLLAAQIATFLQQLHSIPAAVLEEEAIHTTNASPSREEYLAELEALEREVLPLASSQVRRVIRAHFEPLVEGWLDLSHTPALIHGDLGQQHILFDSASQRISGVLDWGVAGLGDPAHDFGVLLNCYGEGFIRRMAKFTPEIVDLIDRARFVSFVAEPTWVLRGLRSENPFWFTVSLGTARDISPIGTRWE